MNWPKLYSGVRFMAVSAAMIAPALSAMTEIDAWGNWLLPRRANQSTATVEAIKATPKRT